MVEKLFYQLFQAGFALWRKGILKFIFLLAGFLLSLNRTWNCGKGQDLSIDSNQKHSKLFVFRIFNPLIPKTFQKVDRLCKITQLSLENFVSAQIRKRCRRGKLLFYALTVWLAHCGQFSISQTNLFVKALLGLEPMQNKGWWCWVTLS